MNFLLQTNPQQMPELSAAPAQQLRETLEPQLAEQMNLFELASKGGVVMIILALLSILAVYLFIERLMVIRKAAKNREGFMNKIRDYMKEGNLVSALNLCEAENTPGAKMIAKGIQRLGRPMQDISVAIENVGNIEVAKLEKSLPLLATVQAAAPMVGFLGTVTGMISAFIAMANAGANVDVSLLSSGIYQALVTTAAGLFIGIACLFAYNYLVNIIDRVVTKSEAQALEFMDMLSEPLNKRLDK